MAGSLSSRKKVIASLSSELSPMNDDTTLTISPRATGIRIFRNATIRAHLKKKKGHNKNIILIKFSQLKYDKHWINI